MLVLRAGGSSFWNPVAGERETHWLMQTCLAKLLTAPPGGFPHWCCTGLPAEVAGKPGELSGVTGGSGQHPVFS